MSAAVARPAAISLSAGSATAATRTSCLAASSGSRGSSPSSIAAGLRSVSKTIKERCRAVVSAALLSAAASVSTSSGSMPAIASATAESTAERGAPTTLARSRRSKAIMSTRSPAREASAVSRRVASMAASRRGTPPTRPADVRPVSSMTRIWRSRSGRQVRTMTSPRRAVARQSMDRTSSPITYSRSESNSLPWPRRSARCWPSSWRSRESFSGRCLRLRNGGRTRTVQGTGCLPWRAAMPSGPMERTVTTAATLSPRRSGASVVVSHAWPPGATWTRACGGSAPALGCQASLMTARSVRRPGFATARPTEARSPSRQRTSPDRVNRSARTEPARATSAAIAATSTAFTAMISAAVRNARISAAPARAASAARPVSAILDSSGDGDGGEHGVYHAVGGGALQLGLGPQLDAMPQRRAGERLDVVGNHEVPACQPGPGPAGRLQRGRAPGGHAQAQRRGLAGGPAEVHDVAGDLGCHGDPADRGTGGREVSGASHRPDACRGEVTGVEPGRVPGQDADLLVPAWHRYGQLDQEPVELRFGQRVGAFVLDRVLGGREQERIGQRPRGSLHRDLAFLHRLEQRRLRFGRRPVDLVGEQQVGEDRPLTELEERGLRVVDQRAGQVTRHQVGGELHPGALQG